MRKETKAMEGIKSMVGQLGLDVDALKEKAKLLLESYRAVVWATAKRARYMEEEAEALFGKRELGAALAYLSDFAPTDERGSFERKAKQLFETQWLAELLEDAMVRVREYPHNGKLYFNILSRCYLDAYTNTESDVAEEYNLERSVYYDRKREAVMLLGVALWGQALPEYLNIVDSKNCFDNFRSFAKDENVEFERFVG